jgi:hypothetical protein
VTQTEEEKEEHEEETEEQEEEGGQEEQEDQEEQEQAEQEQEEEEGAASTGPEHWTAPRRWIDINGYNQDILDLIGRTFGMHEETVKDAGIFQGQKFEVLTPGASSSSAEDAPGKGGLLSRWVGG